MEQRQVFVNNLAIRRATEELKVTRSYEQVGRILTAAFSTNDFDAFELRLRNGPPYLLSLSGLHVTAPLGESPTLRWRKPGTSFGRLPVSAWQLMLDLVTTSNRYCGSMVLYRSYSERGLQLDVNLLTSIFPVALADALDRSAHEEFEIISASRPDAPLAAAQAV
jgi:hypothetical protein